MYVSTVSNPNPPDKNESDTNEKNLPFVTVPYADLGRDERSILFPPKPKKGKGEILIKSDTAEALSLALNRKGRSFNQVALFAQISFCCQHWKPDEDGYVRLDTAKLAELTGLGYDQVRRARAGLMSGEQPSITIKRYSDSAIGYKLNAETVEALRQEGKKYIEKSRYVQRKDGRTRDLHPKGDFVIV